MYRGPENPAPPGFPPAEAPSGCCQFQGIFPPDTPPEPNMCLPLPPQAESPEYPWPPSPRPPWTPVRNHKEETNRRSVPAEAKRSRGLLPLQKKYKAYNFYIIFLPQPAPAPAARQLPQAFRFPLKQACGRCSLQKCRTAPATGQRRQPALQPDGLQWYFF